MYISISAQTLGNNFSQSVGDFVQYLEKENEGVIIEEQEHFFNQYGDEYSAKEVIKDIDNNTAKLKKHEPKFYSITVSPSQRELKQLQNDRIGFLRQEKENMRKGKSNPKPLQDMIDYNSKNIVMKKEQIQSLQSHYRNTKAEYDRIIARLKTLE